MRFSDVRKFFAAFATVVATAATVWVLAAAALPRERSHPADPAAAIDRSDAPRPVPRGEVPLAEQQPHNIDPNSLRMTVHTPFGSFNFGFELDRM